MMADDQQQCRRRGNGPCNSGPTYRVIYRDRARTKVLDTELPFCFAHALAEVDRAQRAGSTAIAEFEPLDATWPPAGEPLERYCVASGRAVSMIPGDRCVAHGAAAQPCATDVRPAQCTHPKRSPNHPHPHCPECGQDLDPDDCCPGERDPLTGDPRGLHSFDCRVYRKYAAALDAHNAELRKRPPALRQGPPEPSAAQVQALADVLTDARLSGVQAGVMTLARIVLAAGYRRVAADVRDPGDPEYADLVMRRPGRELRLAVDEALMSPAGTLTPSQQRLLSLYFDMTCGNCIDGRCHAPAPIERCGCERHEVSVHWRYPEPAAPQDRPQRPGGAHDAA